MLGEKGRWRGEVWHTGTVGILPEITSQYEETMAEGSRDHTYGGGGGGGEEDPLRYARKDVSTHQLCSR